ncbi:MAG: hypothetical protein RLZZ352_735 [Pseudomonadota bacterium]|jgi:two-component system osmolarity sensor histidine kinase EnvZ
MDNTEPPAPAQQVKPATALPPAAWDVWPRRGLSLFWRTFFLLSLLLVVSIFSWMQTYRALEFEPRALQSARQLASLVNLSRAALVHADAIARVSLIKTLADVEGLQFALREPTDVYLLYDQDSLSRNVSQQLQVRLGSDTVVAREVNGQLGLWIGFTIDGDAYWLLTDPSRVGPLAGTTWLIWLAMAALLSLAGAALIARLLNQPLKKLSWAAGRIREGDFAAGQLNEAVPTQEIREVNMGFNRMAQRLNQIEQDRTLMLAGISHDLRTPLARLRLDIELSVADLQAREHMAADIEQVNAIIDKFLDYARPGPQTAQAVPLAQVVQAAVSALGPTADTQVQLHIAPQIQVLGDAVELQRVFANLLENAQRYGKSAGSDVAHIDVVAQTQDGHVHISLRDHGPGVAPELLDLVKQPFFRADVSRSSASGTGLGLAIVDRAVARMGGRFALANASDGGLVAHLQLRVA